MRSRASAVSLVLLSAACLGACNGIGRPLIDDKTGDKERDSTALCILAPECKEYSSYDLPTEIPPIDPSLVDLTVCGVTRATCEGEIDELGVVSHHQCAAEWPTPNTGAVVDHTVFDCATIRVENVDAETELIATTGVELRQVNVTLQTKTPVVVELDDALIDDVTFQLEGPITLRIPRPRQLRHVRVFGRGDKQDEQRFEVSELDGEDVSVMGENGTFSGTVTLENGALRNARILAGTIDASNVNIELARLESDTFDARNSSLTLALLAIGDGRMLGTIVTHAKVTECGALAIVTGEVSRAHIPPCKMPLRVYGAAIEHSFVEGRVEGDRAEFEDVVFGLTRTTDLLAWDSHVFRSNFCEHTRSVRLTASVFLVCPSCPGDSTMVACADTQAVGQITVSDCPVFDHLDDCGKKVPKRPLPP